MTGGLLRNDLDNLKITRKAIAEEFLYERDIMLISGDSGIGKSSIALQIAYDITTSKLLFSSLNIPNNKKFLYLQLEGDYEESIERLRLIEEATGIKTNHDNLMIYELKNFECSDKGQRDKFFEIIESTGFKPDVFCMDPMYKLSGKDIAKSEGALAVVEFSDYAQMKWGCSNMIMHHNLKTTYDIVDKKKVQKGDPYYGHSFLKNHVRTSYSLQKGEGKYSPLLKRQKGRGSDTLSRIELKFNAEFGHTSAVEAIGSADLKFQVAVNKLKASKSDTCFNDFAELSGISEAHLRRYKKSKLFTDNFLIEKEQNKKWEIWRVKR